MAPMAKKQAAVILIEDHPVVRAGMRSLLAREAGLCLGTEAGNVTDAQLLIRQVQPDVALVDLQLREENGFALIEWSRIHFPDLRLRIVSGHDATIYVQHAFQIGAHGFLGKDAAAAELAPAVWTVLGGERYLGADIRARLTPAAVRSLLKGEAPADDGLTSREYEVLERLGQGLGPMEIGKQLHMNVKTIEYHQNNLKLKLGVTTNAEVRQLAIQSVAGKAPPLPVTKKSS
jgi:DNA-binding NarL/FixJ family response regulator